MAKKASKYTKKELEVLKKVKTKKKKTVKKKVCSICNGEGVVDSGGSNPWGEWINVPCPECCPDTVAKTGTCIACGGTGKSSRGGPCYPCSIKKGK